MKGTEIIPYELLSEISLTNGEREEFYRNRRKLLSELRCVTGLPGVISKFNQDSVYKLVLTPEGAKLYQDAQGNLKGVFYKDGKIVEHAKFQEVGPSVLKAAKALGAQVLLISIAMQLNRIEEQVSKLFEEVHADRLAEIEAGKSLFFQACNMGDAEKRKWLTLSALTELTRGFEKTVSALSRQIQKLPEQKISFFDNWLSDKSKQAAETHRIALESYSACLNALHTMARCHLYLNEREVALRSIDMGLEKINNAGVDIAFERSRLAPKINDVFPEEIWKRYIDYRKPYGALDIAELISLKEDIFEIEFKPSEIGEDSHVKL